MLRLLTFGGLRILRGDRDGADLANQRRRLAVLAVVAAAAPGSVSRDRLMMLLWPDSDDEKGRHALNQIVYNLRRELGASPIDGVSDLSLLPHIMTADLVDFRAAIARGDHEAAAELYSGPFLDGFAVPGASEFARWVDDERDRTTRQAMQAIDKLATAAALAGNGSALVQWTGRLVELDPLSARRVLAHMHALEAAGDRDSAIAYGRRYDVLARTNDDDVDPAIAAEVSRLRSLPVRVTVAPEASRLASVAMAPVVDASAQATVPDPSAREADVCTMSPGAASLLTASPRTALPDAEAFGAEAPRPESLGTESPRSESPRAESLHSSRPRHTRVWVPTLIAAAVMLVSVAAWSRTRSAALPLDAGDRMMLAAVQLPAADSASGSALLFALQSALQQSGRVRLVSPASIADALQRMDSAARRGPLTDSISLEVAEREGARYVVSLNVMPSGAQRLVTLRVLDPSSGAVVRTYTESAIAGDLLPAIDGAAGRLRRDLGDSQHDIAAALPLPRATTPSLEALRLLASAREAYNRALYPDARTLYTSAIALDTGFAAAHAGLAAVEYVMNNTLAGDSSAARALALADRLPPRERMLIEAVAARGSGDWTRAASLHRAYLIRYPDDYDLYRMLGYDLMRAGNADEGLAAYDSVGAHRRLTAGDLINIAAMHKQRGRYAQARAAHVAAMRLDSTIMVRSIQNEEFGAMLLRLGFADSARALHSVMLTRTPADQARGHRSLAYVDLYEGKYTSALQHLTAAVSIGATANSGSLSETRDRALLGATLLDMGRTGEARAQLRMAAALALALPYDPALLLWAGKPLARLGDTVTARHLLDSARARTRNTDAGQTAATAALEAELTIARSTTLDGVRAAERAVGADSGAYVQETLAYALERAGDLRAARARYAAIATGTDRALEKEAQQKVRLAPLAVARIDAALGNTHAALQAVDEFNVRWSTADANLPMITALRSQLTTLRVATRR
jgi:DNA-binding SARP family transcriptional activator